MGRLNSGRGDGLARGGACNRGGGEGMVDTGLRLPIRSGTRAHQPTRARPATSSERATYSRREEWQRERDRGGGVTTNDGAEADVLTKHT
jgi:hypothetical protein